MEERRGEEKRTYVILTVKYYIKTYNNYRLKRNF